MGVMGHITFAALELRQLVEAELAAQQERHTTVETILNW